MIRHAKFGEDMSPAPEKQIGTGEDARHSTYAENELPQPHDFVEFGFTNTKPCCIKVSW